MKTGKKIKLNDNDQMVLTGIKSLTMVSKNIISKGEYEYVFIAETKDKNLSLPLGLMQSVFLLTSYLIFPGVLFSVIMAFIVSFLDRKITARLQWRKGPPLWQAGYDFFKLLGKEFVIPPTTNKVIFILSPIVAFSVSVLVAMMVWLYYFNPETSFSGDIIVILYLLMIVPIFYMLGSSSSGNILASVGVSREIKLMLSYELPLITSVLVPIIKSGSIKVGQIMNSDIQPLLFSASGIISFFVLVLCFQAKIGLVPFDVSEAEQEIVSGITVEYSGFLLSFIKLSKQILYSIVPMFLVILFSPGGGVLVWGVKYFLVLILFILIRNTNPRLKIGQVIKFFWFVIFPLSIISVILAINGW